MHLTTFECSIPCKQLKCKLFDHIQFQSMSVKPLTLSKPESTCKIEDVADLLINPRHSKLLTFQLGQIVRPIAWNLNLKQMPTVVLGDASTSAATVDDDAEKLSKKCVVNNKHQAIAGRRRRSRRRLTANANTLEGRQQTTGNQKKVER